MQTRSFLASGTVAAQGGRGRAAQRGGAGAWAARSARTGAGARTGPGAGKRGCLACSGREGGDGYPIGVCVRLRADWKDNLPRWSCDGNLIPCNNRPVLRNIPESSQETKGGPLPKGISFYISLSLCLSCSPTSCPARLFQHQFARAVCRDRTTRVVCLESQQKPLSLKSEMCRIPKQQKHLNLPPQKCCTHWLASRGNSGSNLT